MLVTSATQAWTFAVHRKLATKTQSSRRMARATSQCAAAQISQPPAPRTASPRTKFAAAVGYRAVLGKFAVEAKTTGLRAATKIAHAAARLMGTLTGAARTPKYVMSMAAAIPTIKQSLQSFLSS